MKTRGSEEITLREGLASKSTVKYSGFARFEKDLRGGRGEERRGASLRVWVGVGGERGWGQPKWNTDCAAPKRRALHITSVAPRT